MRGAAWLVICAIAVGACDAKSVSQVTLGERLFADDFNRSEIGDQWETKHRGWTIVGGWVHSTRARNEGLWLKKPLPDNVLIQFDARSEPLPKGKPFPGDIKCEVFAKTRSHEAGYIIVNGGWNNTLDIIARLDEHGKDLGARKGAESSCRGKCRKQRKAAKVTPSLTYRYTIARIDGTVYWFRGNQLQLTYADPEPIGGALFGFNNWESNVYFDNLSIWAL